MLPPQPNIQNNKNKLAAFFEVVFFIKLLPRLLSALFKVERSLPAL